MNKFMKFIVAVFGAFNVVFNLFVPFIVALVFVKAYELGSYNSTIVFSIAIASTIYRVIKFWIGE